MKTIGPLRVIAVREGDAWSAHCLEYHIGAQASSMEESLARLRAVIEVEIAAADQNGVEPFTGIGPAPDKIQKMWENQLDHFGKRNGRPAIANNTEVTLDYAIAA